MGRAKQIDALEAERDEISRASQVCIQQQQEKIEELRNESVRADAYEAELQKEVTRLNIFINKHDALEATLDD